MAKTKDSRFMCLELWHLDDNTGPDHSLPSKHNLKNVLFMSSSLLILHYRTDNTAVFCNIDHKRSKCLPRCLTPVLQWNSQVYDSHWKALAWCCFCQHYSWMKNAVKLPLIHPQRLSLLLFCEILKIFIIVSFNSDFYSVKEAFSENAAVLPW